MCRVPYIYIFNYYFDCAWNWPKAAILSRPIGAGIADGDTWPTCFNFSFNSKVLCPCFILVPVFNRGTAN